MPEALYQCMTKGIIADDVRTLGAPRWATARRGFLRVFSDHLECGDWIIPYEQIQEAQVHHGIGMIISGHLLVVRTKERTYQFGLNPNRFWRGDLPFAVQHIHRSVGRTALVYLFRVLLFLGIGYWVWARFFR